VLGVEGGAVVTEGRGAALGAAVDGPERDCACTPAAEPTAMAAANAADPKVKALVMTAPCKRLASQC
jgi:hypothetical protein